jgi:hypothetical protein
MTPKETFGQLLGLGKAWRVFKVRLEASSSKFVLKLEKTALLWLEASSRGGGHGDLPRPCRADALAASQRLQQRVRDRVSVPRGCRCND